MWPWASVSEPSLAASSQGQDGREIRGRPAEQWALCQALGVYMGTPGIQACVVGGQGQDSASAERALGSLMGSTYRPSSDLGLSTQCLEVGLGWAPSGVMRWLSETAQASVCLMTGRSCARSASWGRPGPMFSSMKEDVPSVLSLFWAIKRSGLGLESHQYPVRSSSPHCPEGTGCLR